MSFLRATAAALVLCASLTPALADVSSPLPAGKPAGTYQAALTGGGLAILLGLGAIIAMTVAIATTDQNKGVTTPTTATGTGA